ncbi:MAG TPA: hypothetical protein VFC11_08125 [Methylocella sp.]|nr:hypothetical protein [Methylocella sp.]
MTLVQAEDTRLTLFPLPSRRCAYEKPRHRLVDFSDKIMREDKQMEIKGDR